MKHPLPPGPGRPKGSTNKINALLRDAILQATTEAGGKAGLVGYLRVQAAKSPAAFLALLGKVLPTQLASDPDAPPAIAVLGIDRPPPETREEWLARRKREMAEQGKRDAVP
ncbi:MAG: hypothetical protein HZY79_02195 [Rhodoblastus sp.]|nr:MAG: hypothetical protein HZY79_02195 [Rhodoblastus sp.]